MVLNGPDHVVYAVVELVLLALQFPDQACLLFVLLLQLFQLRLLTDHLPLQALIYRPQLALALRQAADLCLELLLQGRHR